MPELGKSVLIPKHPLNEKDAAFLEKELVSANRVYLAGCALRGLLSSNKWSGISPERDTNHAILYADMMLKKLNEK